MGGGSNDGDYIQQLQVSVYLQCFTFKSAELSAKDKGKLQQSILDTIFENGKHLFL